MRSCLRCDLHLCRELPSSTVKTIVPFSNFPILIVIVLIITIISNNNDDNTYANIYNNIYSDTYNNYIGDE